MAITMSYCSGNRFLGIKVQKTARSQILRDRTELLLLLSGQVQICILFSNYIFIKVVTISDTYIVYLHVFNFS